jgi:hypothetical protein
VTRIEQAVDELVGGDLLRLGLEVHEHAVPQHGARQRLHIVEAALARPCSSARALAPSTSACAARTEAP